MEQNTLELQEGKCFELCHHILTSLSCINAYETVQHYVNPKNVAATMRANAGIARLFTTRVGNGILARTLVAPLITVTLLPYVLLVYCIPFMCGVGWRFWKDMIAFERAAAARYQTKNNKLKPKTVVEGLLRHSADPITGRVQLTWRQRVEMTGILLFLIFGAIHTTSVATTTVLFRLAQEPTFADEIRAGLETMDEEELLRSAIAQRDPDLLDSFIREALRTRGDVLGSVRKARKDVQLGQYIIPKGSIIRPMSILNNTNPAIYGDTAEEFNPERWVSMTKKEDDFLSGGQGFALFGQGAHICPGRTLAVAIIKLIAASALSICRLDLPGGTYDIKDPLLMALSHPCGTLRFSSI